MHVGKDWEKKKKGKKNLWQSFDRDSKDDFEQYMGILECHVHVDVNDVSC